MGLYDRDYMRNEGRRPNRLSGTDERIDEFASAFIRRHRRALVIAGVILVLLVIAGLLTAFIN